MSFRRIGALALGCAFAAMSLPTGADASSASKELARIKGTVGYRAQAAAPFQPVLGKLDLADDAWAVTETQSAALLRLADSSEVELGERTTVQVGAFNDAASGKQNVVVVDHGALHFKIRHPEGMHSNYTFQTGTSQIAVRGTEAVLVVGPKGTQLTCIECTPGDVTVTTGAQVMTIVTGQTLTVLGSTPFNAAASVAQNVAVHNPAVDQFASARNALGTHASSVAAVDPTGAVGAVQGSAAAAAGASAAGVAAAAGGVAAVAAVAAGHSGGASAPSTSTPTPSAAPTATPSVAPTASPTAAPTASPTVAPSVAPTATPSASPTSSPSPKPSATPVPTASPTASASPTPSPAPSASPTPNYGPLLVTPTSIDVPKDQTSGNFTVHQDGPSGQITIDVNAAVCNGDHASLTASPTSAPVGSSTTTITITATGNGGSDPNVSCAIPVKGMGGQATAVNINFGNKAKDHARRPVPSSTAPRAAGTATKPGSVPPAGFPMPTPAAGPGPGAAPGRPGPGIPH